MVAKYGWLTALMRISNNDPRLVDWWTVQPFRKLLLHIAYHADETVFNATNKPT